MEFGAGLDAVPRMIEVWPLARCLSGWYFRDFSMNAIYSLVWSHNCFSVFRMLLVVHSTA